MGVGLADLEAHSIYLIDVTAEALIQRGEKAHVGQLVGFGVRVVADAWDRAPVPTRLPGCLSGLPNIAR